MATIKLSGIVTSIAGSIAGTTFRRQRGTIVVYNKPQGNSRNKNLQNSRLNALRSLLTAWRSLSASEQSAYNAQALLYTFPDKFGTPRHLSGRDLYTKLNGNLLVMETAVFDINAITNVVPTFTIDFFKVNFSTNTVTASLSNVTGEAFFIFQVEISPNPLNAPQFTRRKILIWQKENIDFDVEFYAEFMAQFPYANKDYNYRLYVTSTNVDGFRGVPQFIEASITPP